MIMIRINFQKVEELRKKRHIRSQAELARRSGWDVRHFNRVIKETQRGGDPSVTLQKLNGLCNALRCKVATILEHNLDPED